MTHHARPDPAPAAADPGRHVAQLREALRLVERIAGGSGGGAKAELDEAARISDAYDRASPIVQRRFDALAAETAGWATVGVEALLAAAETAPPRAAAARIAAQLDRALRELAGLLR